MPRWVPAFLFSKGHEALMLCFALLSASSFELGMLCVGWAVVPLPKARGCSDLPILCPSIPGNALAQGAVILLQLDSLDITKLKTVKSIGRGEKEEKSMVGFSGWKGEIAAQLSAGTHFPHSSCHVLLILCLGCSSEIIKLSPMGNNYLLKIFEEKECIYNYLPLFEGENGDYLLMK